MFYGQVGYSFRHERVATVATFETQDSQIPLNASDEIIQTWQWYVELSLTHENEKQKNHNTHTTAGSVR